MKPPKIRSVTVRDMAGKVVLKIGHKKNAYYVDTDNRFSALVEIRDERNCLTVIQCGGKEVKNNLISL